MSSPDLLFAVTSGIVLGVVQGISEWLPISSKTQVIIVSSYLFGLTFIEGYSLGLFLEAGTFVAAVAYFRREVWLVLKAIVGKGGRTGWLLLKFLIIATVITGIMGVIIYVSVSSLSLGRAIGVPMLILGAVLLLDGALISIARSKYTPTKKLEDLTLKDMAIIGFAQGLAAFPGVSRSGVTVSTMLLLETEAKESFRLSFIALIPASIGATTVTLLFSRSEVLGAVSQLSTTTIAVAIPVAIIVGLLTINWLLKAASSRRITALVFALGIIAIAGGLISILAGVGS